jgi:hypothetical protein
MFDEEEVDEDEVMTLKKQKNPLRINKSLHLKIWDGVDDTEVSMKNKDSLTVKFSDDENTYNLYIKIDIKQFYLRTDKMTLLLMMLKEMLY